MSLELKDLKNPQTIFSITAILSIAGVSIYYQRQLTNIRNDLDEVKAHLATIIASTDPSARVKIDQLVSSVRLLDQKLLSHDKHIEDLKLSIGEVPAPDDKIKRWVRFTPNSVVSSEKDNIVEKTNADADLNAELQAMMQ
ncbi:MAG: hypothetical protein Solivirus1_71 [Solivirus sp.]|uniref:Uncharacterized protein n=1 Tax=Solivirus sp. TaxID=2487772 RepID=A0A3G5AH44_9VIRU|nr:MAG: hypothetical protein Solivirus1_71 [Solivirus sp.]